MDSRQAEPEMDSRMQHFITQLASAFVKARIAGNHPKLKHEDGTYMHTFLDRLQIEFMDGGLDVTK